MIKSANIMNMRDRTCLFSFIILSLFYITGSSGQQMWSSVTSKTPSNRRVITWCTIGSDEQKKCLNLAKAMHRDIIKVGYTAFELDCKQAFNKEECMIWLDEEKATLMTVDAGEVFEAGRYHSLVPVAQEVSVNDSKYDYSVAVVKKNTLRTIASISDLRNRKACFAGVGTLSGWIAPVYALMHQGGMPVVDCNNHVKSVTEFFGPSCAIKALSDKYNPLGDNSDKLCSICIGEIPGGRCTESDPYAGYEGAFRCLLEAGEIAFLKHSTVPQLAGSSEFPDLTNDNFELLCMDGSFQPIENFRLCNWGRVPTNAIVTTSASSFEDRRLYQKFLAKLAEKFSQKSKDGGLVSGNNYENRRNSFSSREKSRFKRQTFFDRPTRNNTDPFRKDPYILNNENYGVNIDPYAHTPVPNQIDFHGIDSTKDSGQNVPYEPFELFESTLYGTHRNLMFQDTTYTFTSLSENQQSYSGFLGETLNLIMGVRHCPVDHMTLCVTSDPELEKCVKMRTALKAQLIKPEMRCEKGHSQINCMEMIRLGQADVIVLDTSDVYTAGLDFELIPFMSEVYNLGEPFYYAVAVAKEADPDTDLTYLKGKYTCHGGINTAAGWVYPLAYLISNEWIRPYGCNSIRAAAEYFTKSCVPGALSTEYNVGVPYDNLCDLCHGSSFRYCRRDASDDYYGHTGAFRCLVEGGGEVAFVKHTTVMENTNGKRREWWARDALIDDFELLCPDGTRAEIQNYESCNLGIIKANAIVTRGGYGYNETQINAYINLFSYAQTFYSRKNADEFSFSMFSSPAPYSDLIFQDATQQLMVIPHEQRFYSEYVGNNFMKARRIVDCYAGVANVQSSFFLLAISLLFALTQYKS